MDIKAIIEKVKKGETLEADEVAFMRDFDFQKFIDGAQAEARRKAEAAADAERKAREALEAKKAELEAALTGEKAGKLSEVEKLQAAIRDLSGKFEAAEKKAAELSAAQARAQRSAKVQDLAKKHGVEFIDGVNVKIFHSALEQQLASVENLDDEAVVKPLVDGFKNENKAALRDLSGGGSGTPPRDGAGSSTGAATTPQQREAELKKSGII